MPNRRTNIVGQRNMALIRLLAVLKLLVHRTLIVKLFTTTHVQDPPIIYAHYQLQTPTIQVVSVAYIKKILPNHSLKHCLCSASNYQLKL